jgi:predicted transport protein
MEKPMKSYVRPERISLKLHPEYNEKWVQELIADDPTILGLGDLVLRDKERSQPRAGRLDLLLQEQDAPRRYEVEIQLGATDEAHIIRTIEYWDLERKRYPQYDHCAVLIAEDITSRFLNVVSLFNGSIPLIAIQLQAFKVAEQTTVIFTKVLDEMSRGLVDEDEDAASAPTDRAYWEKRGSRDTVRLADEILAIARKFDQTLELKYNKFYIGLSRSGQAYNFIVSRPRKTTLNLELKLPQTEEIDEKINKANIETLEYATRWGAYRLSLKREDIFERRELLSELIGAAFDHKGT